MGKDISDPLFSDNVTKATSPFELIEVPYRHVSYLYLLAGLSFAYDINRSYLC